jgi:hypothetical protein
MDYWVALPEQWEFAAQPVLELHFSHSPVLIERLSSLTVAVNDQPINSTFLNAQNARNGRVSWPIDPNHMKLGDSNRITITAKMRSDLELCDDVHSPALWLTLEKTSHIVLPYREKPVTLDVSAFPASYIRPAISFQPEEPDQTHAILVIPTNPSDVVLQAIPTIGARMGVETRFSRGHIDVWSIDQLTEDAMARLSEHHLIIVGPASFVTKFINEGLETPDQLAAPNVGYLIESRNPWNPSRRALVLTSLGDDGLAKVIGAIRHPHLSKQWEAEEGEEPHRSEMIVVSPPSHIADPPELAETYTMSLADLGSTDITSRGKFHHYMQMAFPNPFVGRIQEPAFLRLQLSYSELLLPQTSSLLVKVNGEPVRSVRLAPRTAAHLETDVILPQKFLRGRSLVVTLEFFLDIGDPDCHYNFPEMAWATVYNTSFVAFPLSEGSTTSLRSFPWVVSKDENLAKLTFLTSETPSDEELASVANVAAFLGRSLPRAYNSEKALVPQSVLPSVHRVTEASAEELAKNDLIVIGDFDVVRSKVELAQSVPENLFIHTPATDDPATYAGANFRRNAGWIHLAESPWNPKRNLLVVSASTGAKAISKTARHLWMPDKVDRLGGSTVLVGPNGSMQVLIPAPGEEPQAAPTGAAILNAPTLAVLGGTELADEDGDGLGANGQSHAAGDDAKHHMAYLVFVALGLLLLILVVVRIRDSLRSDTEL